MQHREDAIRGVHDAGRPARPQGSGQLDRHSQHVLEADDLASLLSFRHLEADLIDLGGEPAGIARLDGGERTTDIETCTFANRGVRIPRRTSAPIAIRRCRIGRVQRVDCRL